MGEKVSRAALRETDLKSSEETRTPQIRAADGSERAGSTMAKFPETIPALQSSWGTVGSAVGLQAAGVLFFKRIFEIAPQALGLFSFKEEENLYESTALKAHATKVMTTVGVAVSKLDDLPTLIPVLQELGKSVVCLVQLGRRVVILCVVYV